MSTRPDSVPWAVRIAALTLFFAGLMCVGVATHLHRVSGYDGRVFLLAATAAGLFVGYWKLRFGWYDARSNRS